MADACRVHGSLGIIRTSDRVHLTDSFSLLIKPYRRKTVQSANGGGVGSDSSGTIIRLWREGFLRAKRARRKGKARRLWANTPTDRLTTDGPFPITKCAEENTPVISTGAFVSSVGVPRTFPDHRTI